MADGWPNVAVWYSGGLVESNGSWTCAAGCTSFVAIDHSSLDFFCLGTGAGADMAGFDSPPPRHWDARSWSPAHRLLSTSITPAARALAATPSPRSPGSKISLTSG